MVSLSKAERAIEFLKSEGFENALRRATEPMGGKTVAPGIMFAENFKVEEPAVAMPLQDQLGENIWKDLVISVKAGLISTQLAIKAVDWHTHVMDDITKRKANAEFIDDGASRRSEKENLEALELEHKTALFMIVKDVFGIRKDDDIKFENENERRHICLERRIPPWPIFVSHILEGVLVKKDPKIRDVMLEWLPTRKDVMKDLKVAAESYLNKIKIAHASPMSHRTMFGKQRPEQAEAEWSNFVTCIEKNSLMSDINMNAVTLETKKSCAL